MRPNCKALLASIIFAFVGPVWSNAQAEKMSGFQTNENYVRALRANGDLAMAEPRAVFQRILETLPDRVHVYPTENYYYFSFHHKGVRYAGNIRLEIEARDRGELFFTYFRAANDQHPDGEGQRAVLGAKNGVKLEKVKDLVWRVSSGGRTVEFQLNDLSAVRPPAGLMAKTERYIGPVFDESGMRFFLVFDDARAEFLFVLDETVAVADEFSPSEADANMLLGRRTGFLFFSDKRLSGRKVLIGVYGSNVELNNYFDGPFDQLPDNFIAGDSLRAAILKQQPELKGKIDRFGNLSDGENRVLISPYATYQTPEDLQKIAACIRGNGLPVAEDCLAPPAEQEKERAPN